MKTFVQISKAVLKYHASSAWLWLALSWVSLALAADAGWFGLEMKVRGGGMFWNPTVESIIISGTAPGSPAAEAHLAADDEIVEINGLVVARAKGKLVNSKMDLAVGETLHLKLRRADGEVYAADLVAAPRPR